MLGKETSEYFKVLVAQLCPTLCDPMDPTRLLCSRDFPRQEYWTGLPLPPPGDLPNPGIKPRPLALQADSLPSEPPGKYLLQFFRCNLHSKIHFLGCLNFDTCSGCVTTTTETQNISNMLPKIPLCHPTVVEMSPKS